MASHFTVVYDACVLYPASLRNLLMNLALTDLYRARWTHAIHEEWTRNLIAHRPDLNPASIYRTRDLMNLHVREALVENYEHLKASIELPDPDDVHVVAAAIHCKAFPYRHIQSEGLPHRSPEQVQHRSAASRRFHR